MSKCGVLIVDDEPAFLTGLFGLFGDTYNVFTATNGAAALQTLARERIGVIVTDYQMPGMNGLELLVTVKQRFPAVVRVLMTAYADMNLVIRALNEGEIQRFVAKPYRAQEFARILAECRDLAVLAEGRSEVRQGRTVIVAHDSTTCQSALRMLLSPAYEVLTTANGVEAMNWLAARPIDAIVLGVGLEMLDGCSIASYLRKEKKLRLPIVFWADDVDGDFGSYLEECGADLVLDQRNPDSLPRLRQFLAKQLS